MTVKNERSVYTACEEDFRSIVCNITNLSPNDPIFDRIEEQDKRIMKSYTRAIDMIKALQRYGIGVK
jgi:hypothetical protein